MMISQKLLVVKKADTTVGDEKPFTLGDSLLVLMDQNKVIDYPSPCVQTPVEDN